ncbi:MAG: hypothetical protein WCT50_00040 [Patescibacteria group bacterium]
MLQISNKNFTTEREGQLHFFKNFGINVDEQDVLIANTDGVYKGNIFEFKLNINNTQQVLFQAIKYLSRLRLTGNPVPRNILLISLNQAKAYIFNSEDYFDEIHEIYYGGASKNNDGFVIKNQPVEINYSTDIGADKVLKILNENIFTKIKIDEDCIVGWAGKFYRENPTAKKSDFLDDKDGGEIRKPIKFKDYILPFKEKTNIKFKYLMDKLNDNLIKKELGAFFTPPAYAKKSVELVREAIKNVPKNNDYIILDRCAGTGNLEAELSDEELSHTIISTYEYYEYKVLLERFNGRVRHIIPPTDDNVVFSAGFVVNADALSEDFVNNEIIKQYIDNSKCAIILFENPPYAEAGAIQTNEARTERGAGWKKSFMAKEIKNKVKGVAKNDLANLFIWSGFEKYLRSETDSYILFSPVKYFKSQNLVNKKFEKGLIFNRKHFHAGASAISCVLWSNTNKKQDIFDVEIYDLDDKRTLETTDDEVKFLQKFKLKKVYSLLSALYDTRQFSDDIRGITIGYDGRESRNVKIRISPLFNKNIIGYLVAQSFSFENPRMLSNLFRTAIYNGNGFYLRSDNFLEKLPLFAVGKYPIEDKWYENGVIFKTSDMSNKYTKDKDFLKSCFIFSCLSRYNKCLSFIGSDKRFYKNELCFSNNTLASEQLDKFKLNTEEKELINIWQNVLSEAQKIEAYNKKFAYGPYQVEIELNTSYKDDNNKTVYDNPTLNGELENLKKKLKIYYAKYITPKLFEYELLK